jgi:hypothetical protein
MSTETLPVTVVVDRESRQRREFWTGALAQVKAEYDVDTTVELCPLADLVNAPLDPNEPVLLELLEHTKVLIVNWDAINGDPDFGADVALAWFRHRRAALRVWVRKGGVLILEGQANLGVPAQESYDAILGDSELLVSGAEDPNRPEQQVRRMFGPCRATRVAHNAPSFAALDDIHSQEQLTHADMFPPDTAGRLVAGYIRQGDYSAMVYRGWFRRSQHARAQRLRWVPYARRAKRWPLNYPTIMTAKSGDGVIFATTMLLSATRQLRLIQAMLLTQGKVRELPEPATFKVLASRYGLKALAGLITAVVALSFATVEPVWKAVLTAVIALVVTLLLDYLPVAWRFLTRLLRIFSGA